MWRTAVVCLMVVTGCANNRAGTSWTDGKSRNLLDEPRHPVTQPMWQRSRAIEGKPAPDFTLTGADGKPVNLSEERNGGAVMLVFTKDGCPCSIESQPFFNTLAKGYAGHVTFLGIIDAPKHVASKYHDDFSVPYEMVLAGEGDVFRVFDARQSVYSTLVAKDGTVVRQWPGYSKKLLVEINAALSKVSGQPLVKLDTAMAPDKESSGCAFVVPDPR